jgi:hypothetical protein
MIYNLISPNRPKALIEHFELAMIESDRFCVVQS